MRIFWQNILQIIAKLLTYWYLLAAAAAAATFYGPLDFVRDYPGEPVPEM